MKMKRLLHLCYLFFASGVLFSQSQSSDFLILPGVNSPMPQEKCASHYLDKRLMENDPVYKAKRDAINLHTLQVVQQAQTNRSGGVTRGTVYTIPVVVHIMHEGEAVGTGTNISDAQIQSCVAALIRDFRRNSDDGGIAQTGPLGIDAEMEFCLAAKDPLGNPTNGITRHDMSGVQGYLDSGVYHSSPWRLDNGIKSLVQWDPSKYMNVWVVNKIKNLLKAHDSAYSGGVQGYATFPGGSPSSDGIVMLYSCTGNDPSGTQGYNLWSATMDNRVFTHEIGHYFNLYHTFQGGSCAAESNCSTQGDLCCDTPPTTVGTGNDCISPQCSGAENKENYMQYQNGDCASDFTPDQVARMRALFAPGGAREQLAQTTNCLSPFPINPYVASIQYPIDSSCTNNIIGKAIVCNGGTSVLTSFDVIYDIDGVSPQTYNWTGTLASNVCDTITFPMIVTTNGNHNYNVTIDSTNINGASPDGYTGDNLKSSAFYSINGNGLTVDITTDCKADDISWEIIEIPSLTVWASGSGYAPGVQNIFEEACLDSGCYEFRIYDVAGNGMKATGLCPSDGYFTLTDLTSGFPVVISPADPNWGASATYGFCMPFNPSLTVDYSGCDSIFEGESVSFTDLSTGVPNPQTWNWDFGDGGTSTQQNPSHQYLTAGTYNVKLVVSNGAISDSITKTNCVVVSSRPPGYCDTLRNYSDSDSIVTYLPLGGWGHFPGHNSSSIEGYAEPFNLVAPTNSIQKVRMPVFQAYSGSPSSNFVLNVYDDNAGQPGTILSTDTIPISSLIVGMNEINIGSPPVLTGDFWVGFEVDYGNGDTLGVGTALSFPGRDSTTFVKVGSLWLSSKSLTNLNSSLGIDVIFTDLPALGNYTVSDQHICAGQTITFDASAATNYDSLTWYFPGGTPSTSTNLNVTVTYPTGGNYEAILHLTSICSNDSNRIPIEVDASTPVVSFTESASSICKQDTIIFDGSATTGSNLTTTWTFPTGAPSTSSQFSDKVIFNTSGVYNIKFSAYNGCGGDSVTKPININDFPATTVTPYDTTICEGNSVTLSAMGGSSFDWSTGDTNSTETVAPSTTTTYWVTSNNGSCTGDTAQATVTINPVPDVVANASPFDTVCLGSTVSFTMNGSNAIYYSWDFGDGNTSNIPNTTHTYASVGTYNVQLTGVYGICDSTNTILLHVVSCSGGPSSIDEKELASLVKIFPNPTNSILNIDATYTDLTSLDIEILNNTGKIVYINDFYEANKNILTIDLNDYAEGVYLIKFNTKHYSFTKRLVILK